MATLIIASSCKRRYSKKWSGNFVQNVPICMIYSRKIKNFKKKFTAFCCCIWTLPNANIIKICLFHFTVWIDTISVSEIYVKRIFIFSHLIGSRIKRTVVVIDVENYCWKTILWTRITAGQSMKERDIDTENAHINNLVFPFLVYGIYKLQPLAACINTDEAICIAH